MLLLLYLLTSLCSHTQVNNRYRDLSTQDPSLLLISVAYPSKPLTIFDTSNKMFTTLPVGLTEISEEMLPFQLFHTYYENYRKNFYLMWNGDSNVKVVVEGDYLIGKRGYTDIHTYMTAHPSNGNIVHSATFNDNKKQKIANSNYIKNYIRRKVSAS